MSHSEKSILVTGAGGSIGSELCLQLVDSDFNLLLILDNSEAALFSIYRTLTEKFTHLSDKIIPIVIDLTNPNLIKNIFSEYNIDIIYHTAAYKHVYLSQLNEKSYLLNNILATIVVADLAEAKKANLVMVSTDKAVWPQNIMGISKRLSEMCVLSMANLKRIKEKVSIVRFGNVLNSSGSVIPIFKNQIAKKQPVTVTDPNVTRYFMSISEAVELILSASHIEEACGIYTLDMGPAISILNLAKNTIEESGYRVTFNTPMENEIRIKFIGLRTGEKLHETLSYSKVQPTIIPKVMRSDEFLDFDNKILDYCNPQNILAESFSTTGINWENFS